MGMFDNIKCNYPIEINCYHGFQTKSLINLCDNFEIREDGTLWREEYDVEDQSDPNAEGIGMATRVNERWEEYKYTGEIRFYTNTKNDVSGEIGDWLEYIALFSGGKLIEIHRDFEAEKVMNGLDKGE